MVGTTDSLVPPPRPSYDQLLELDADDTVTETSTIVTDEEDVDTAPQSAPEPTPSPEEAAHRRAALLRLAALLAACWFSVGSHYSSYVLGPIKSRLLRELGSTHTEFSLLLSAYSLNSTWTPLVGGLLASHLGTTYTSIIATGVIFLGQALVLTGNIFSDIRIMALGMFIFGLGVSPLAVVQETIIIRFFKSRGLGVSMATGLVAGKLASFISARTTFPLSERFGTKAPFYVSTTLAATSVIVNLIYIAASKWLVDECEAIPEAPDIHDEALRRRSVHHLTEAEALEKVAEKKKVKLREVPRLGDVFWTYVGLNVFCGMIWHPFAHLAANIIEKRYGMTESSASTQASYLLAGSFFLYPICGYIVDHVKRKPIIIYMMLLSSTLTMMAYAWLALPPSWTHTSWPGIALYAVGQGYAPLLLVVIVPKIVPLKYVSTALGVHKCLETSGSTIFQTAAGLILDMSKGKSSISVGKSYQIVINIFLLLNVCQFLTILCVWYLQRRKKAAARRSVLTAEDIPGLPSTALSDSAVEGERQPLLGDPHRRRRRSSVNRSSMGGMMTLSAIWNEDGQETPERKRGKVFASFFAVLIIATWGLFLGTAWFRLGTHKPHS